MLSILCFLKYDVQWTIKNNYCYTLTWLESSKSTSLNSCDPQEALIGTHITIWESSSVTFCNNQIPYFLHDISQWKHISFPPFWYDSTWHTMYNSSTSLDSNILINLWCYLLDTYNNELYNTKFSLTFKQMINLLGYVYHHEKPEWKNRQENAFTNI